MKSRKFIVLLLCVAMVCTSGSFAFAAEALETQAPAEPALAEENTGIQEESATVEQAGEEESMLAEEISEDAVLETAGEKVAGNITVHYPPSLSDKLDTTVTVEYSDDFFSEDNSTYNKKLAKFLLAASLAGYAYPVELDNQDGIKRDKNIEALLEDELKYSGYKSYKYDVELSNSDDTAGYAFAFKELESGERVMAVVIRSYGYGSEWASNLRVTGGEDEHKGFANTADAVYKDVKAYAQANGITKIWITGYSRGAAVANVLGKRVADGKLVDTDDLYCYTYETPTTIKKSIAVQGIYNVINSADVVAQIPFYFWGYQRYGQDEFYVVNKVSLKNYKKGMSSSKLKALKKKITYVVPTQWSNGIALECISSIFGGNESAFKDKYEEVLQTVGGAFLGGEANLVPRKANQGQGVVDIMTMIGLHSYMQSNGVNSTAVFAQHTPEALFFWMDTISPTQSLEYKYITLSNSYKKCNILIKDSKGKKVAEINKGNYSKFIKKNATYSLEVNKDENGNLQILIPADDRYSFKLSANSAVKLDYKVTDYTRSNVVGIADYKSITLKKKGTITAKASNNYAPKLSKGNIGSKNVYDSSSVALVSVNADVQDGSNFFGILQTSFVTGTGKYPENYEVKLTVHNADPNNYAIDGWYLNGEKISSTAKCTITTDSSKAMDLVVKFKQKN